MPISPICFLAAIPEPESIFAGFGTSLQMMICDDIYHYMNLSEMDLNLFSVLDAVLAEQSVTERQAS